MSLGKQFKGCHIWGGRGEGGSFDFGSGTQNGWGRMYGFTCFFNRLSAFTDHVHYRFEIDVSLKQSNNRSTFWNWRSHNHFEGLIRQCVLLPMIRQLFCECLERDRKTFCNATTYNSILRVSLTLVEQCTLFTVYIKHIFQSIQVTHAREIKTS